MLRILLHAYLGGTAAADYKPERNSQIKVGV